MITEKEFLDAISVIQRYKNQIESMCFSLENCNKINGETKIETIDFSIGLHTILKKAKIYTVKDLISHSWGDINSLKYFGAANYEEITRFLRNNNLKLSNINKLPCLNSKKH